MKLRVGLAALAATLIAAQTSFAGGKPRIAVLEFGHKALNSRWWGSGGAAQDMFITSLVKSGKFTVVDRERLAAIMQEKNLSLSGDVDPATAVKAGRLIGVEYMLFGNVTEFGETENKASVGWGVGLDVKKKKFVAALDCRLVSTTTGEILWADTGKKEESATKVFVFGTGGGVDDDRMFDKVLRPIVEELASKLADHPLETSGSGTVVGNVKGKIASVEGGKILINLGSDAGVKVGDTFGVYRMGKQIKDPDSGEVLGAEEEQIGELKVVAVKGARLSECVMVSGSGFGVGNLVK
jgi:curli biogenesis system outer membrane secretion channel CsgG